MSAIGDRLRQYAGAEKQSGNGQHPTVREDLDSALESLSDTELLRLLQNGVQEALGILFVRYRRLVLSIALRTLRDEGEAEDVAQDVFLEISKKAKIFDPARGTVKMWILQYAHSRSLNRRLYLALRQRNGRSRGNGNHPFVERAVAPQALDELTLEEHGSTIRKAMQDLLPKQKKVIGLAYFQGLLMKEIANEMGETLGNVRNHYYRGLKRLQQILSHAPASNGK
jgi:RNA polymerase sigma-70 factor, ECF subfamily